MDLHYSAGTIKALEKLGLDLSPAAIKKFVHEKPSAVVGGVIGTGLAGKTLLSNKEPTPKMERPFVENNPLIYAAQH